MGWGGRGINLQMKRLMGWVDDDAYGFMQITLNEAIIFNAATVRSDPYPYLRGLFNSTLSY